MNLELFILGAMVFVLLAFAGLVRAGTRALGPGASRQEAEPPARWPRVALIVPVAGAPPGLRTRLLALLRQDYPDFQVIFATRDRHDPATAAIAALIWGWPRARLVVSGPARTSGQKNQNLLAGLRLAGADPEILAFGDSSQEAPADFLRRLVAPLARGEGAVTCGYHHVIPGDRLLATVGRAVTVLALYLTKAVPWLNQPWGGATAIRRDLFYTLEVDRLWAQTVVDDVSLAARLLRARLPVRLSPGATLATPAVGETLSSWQSWLFRQWIYLKYYLPGSWLAAGILLHLLNFLILVSVARLLLGFWGGATPLALLPAVGFLVCLSALALYLRRLHPAPGPWPRWLAGFLAALAMAAWVHLRTCLTQHISWRGITYRVDWRGRVTAIKEDGGGGL